MGVRACTRLQDSSRLLQWVRQRRAPLVKRGCSPLLLDLPGQALAGDLNLTALVPVHSAPGLGRGQVWVQVPTLDCGWAGASSGSRHTAIMIRARTNRRVSLHKSIPLGKVLVLVRTLERRWQKEELKERCCRNRDRPRMGMGQPLPTTRRHLLKALPRTNIVKDGWPGLGDPLVSHRPRVIISTRNAKHHWTTTVRKAAASCRACAVAAFLPLVRVTMEYLESPPLFRCNLWALGAATLPPATST